MTGEYVIILGKYQYSKPNCVGVGGPFHVAVELSNGEYNTDAELRSDARKRFIDEMHPRKGERVEIHLEDKWNWKIFFLDRKKV
jgi:hypothetical protein